jgi:uncharacterized repeat protein (TIGR01451 family)
MLKGKTLLPVEQAISTRSESMKFLLHSLFLAGGLAFGGLAAAQAPAVTTTLQASRVDLVDGKAVHKPAESGRPGDLIEYAGTYRNAGKAPVDRLAATIPVPVGTTLVAASAEPAGAQASTDGVRFAAMPLLRTVRQADGSTRQEPVPLADYRFVRWDLGTLPASAERVVRLRVRIDAAEQAAAAKP